MPMIPWMRGDHNSSIHFLAVVNTPTAHTVEITPISQELHAMTVELADNVQVNRQLQLLLNRADIKPPPPGTQLTVAHVNERLSAAGMTSDERITVKRSLADLKLLSEGPAYNIWKQS